MGNILQVGRNTKKKRHMIYNKDILILKMISKSYDSLLINCPLFIHNKGTMGKSLSKHYGLILVFDSSSVIGNGGNCWLCFIGK